MIKKLYNLKKMQTDQKVLEKAQLMSKITDIENEIVLTNNQMVTATVNKFGAISDFSVLQIHKNTMKSYIMKLQASKRKLESQVEELSEVIVELQKEREKFDYLVKEEKKRKFKALLKAEEEEAAEYMQSKYIAS